MQKEKESEGEVSEDELSDDEVPLAVLRKSKGTAKKRKKEASSSDDEEDFKPVSETWTSINAFRLNKVQTDGLGIRLPP